MKTMVISTTCATARKAEDRRDWLVGPNREVLFHHLDATGIAPALNMR